MLRVALAAIKSNIPARRIKCTVDKMPNYCSLGTTQSCGAQLSTRADKSLLVAELEPGCGNDLGGLPL